ncbi:MAG: tricarballylate utilization 4Fe-4S protein TcuB [Pseudomonadota bacterium]
MLDTEGPLTTTAEARRVAEICNACRYCESYCPVFPEMFARRSFNDGDLSYLANLCHNCKGCWHACQYAPPHPFGVNLPATLADLRVESYAEHAFPKGFGRAFERNGAIIALATSLILIATLLGAMLLVDGTVMTGVHTGEGAFYAVIPHNTMVALGGATFGWAILAMILSVRSFWKSTGGGPIPLNAWVGAFKDAGSTRHLGSYGGGCNDVDEGYSQSRRHAHTMTMWGFLLCFASTSLGTLMHYFLGWEAPYSWYSAPVVLGTIGGIGLLVGPAALLWIKLRTDPAPEGTRRWGMDTGFIGLLFFVSLTGIALLLFRHTSAMGWLLAVHLGVVLAFFVTLPYGKFVHGIYRFAALLKMHAARR